MATNIAKMLFNPRVLIIGAGPTSALIANNIMKTPNLCKILKIWVWEKAKGTGGRFSTLRSDANSHCFLDLGALYMEQSDATKELTQPYFEELLHDELIREVGKGFISGYKDTGMATFVPTKGTSTIVRNYYNKAGIKHKLMFQNDVNSINIVDVLGKQKVQVCTRNGEEEVFDIVIATIPIPALLEFDNFEKLLDKNEKSSVISNLEAVKYSSRFSVGALFDNPITLKADDKAINYSDDSTVRLWSYENFKRTGNYKNNEPFSLTVHTAPGYEPSFPYMDDYEFKHKLYKEIRNNIKYLQDEDNVPRKVKVHFWKHSQVLTPYQGQPGFVVLKNNPMVLAAGDGFSRSGFSGCIESASKIVKFISSKFPEVVPDESEDKKRRLRYRKPVIHSEKSNKVSIN